MLHELEQPLRGEDGVPVEQRLGGLAVDRDDLQPLPALEAAAAASEPLAGADGLDRGDPGAFVDARRGPWPSSAARSGGGRRRTWPPSAWSRRRPARRGSAARRGRRASAMSSGSRERWNRSILKVPFPRVSGQSGATIRDGRARPGRLRPSRRWARRGPRERWHVRPRCYGTVGTPLRSVSGPTVLPRTDRGAGPSARGARARPRAHRRRGPGRQSRARSRRRRRSAGGWPRAAQPSRAPRSRPAGSEAASAGPSVGGGSSDGLAARRDRWLDGRRRGLGRPRRVVRLRGLRRHDRGREVGPEVFPRRQAGSVDARRELTPDIPEVPRLEVVARDARSSRGGSSSRSRTPRRGPSSTCPRRSAASRP